MSSRYEFMYLIPREEYETLSAQSKSLRENGQTYQTGPPQDYFPTDYDEDPSISGQYQPSRRPEQDARASSSSSSNISLQQAPLPPAQVYFSPYEQPQISSAPPMSRNARSLEESPAAAAVSSATWSSKQSIRDLIMMRSILHPI